MIKGDTEEVGRSIISKLNAGKTPTVISNKLESSRNIVYRSKALIRPTGDVKACHGGGSQKMKWTKATVRAVKARIKHNPRCTTRWMAKDFQMSDFTMRKLITEDLGMKNRAVVPRHYLSPQQKDARKDRSKVFLSGSSHIPAWCTSSVTKNPSFLGQLSTAKMTSICPAKH